MRRYLGVFLFLALVGSLDAYADAVSCQNTFVAMTTANQYPTYCPFDYATTGRPSVIHLKDFNCASDPIGPSPVSDRTCWQQALNCAFNPAQGSFHFGAVEATEGVNYSIDDTICLIGAQGGVINGNGARLYWTGPNAALSPMFYFGGDQEMKIENLKLTAVESDSPMHTAILFGSTTSSPIVSHQNHLENIFVNGVTTGSIQYGIRFAGPSGFAGNPLNLWDANNDLFILDSLIIAGVDKAGISIEHTQSFHHHLMNVELYASEGNATVESDDCMNTDFNQQTQSCNPGTKIMGASGVRAINNGSFDSYGGFVGGFANAAYFIDSVNRIGITNHSSEGCGRLIRTQNGSVGFLGNLSLNGGRYAANLINSDNRIIEWFRTGPLTIHGLSVDGLTGQDPIKFYIEPQLVAGATAGIAEVDISHVSFFIYGSANWSDIIELANPTRTHLVAVGNECMDATPAVAGCPGYGGGADQAVAVVKNKNLSDASNSFPSTLVTTTGAQTVSGKDLTTGNTFPNTLATTNTGQALTSKTLTDSTNVFPGLGLLSMSGVIASGTAATCLGPGGGTTATCASGSASDSAAAMPVMTLRSMRCRTAATFASGRSWTFSLRRNGTNQSGWSCTFDSSSTSCTVTPSGGLTLAAGDLIDLRSTGNVSQAPTGRMTCSVTVGF